MAELEVPVEETRDPGNEGRTRFGIDKAYLFSPRGILKIVEFILLLIAFSACANFKAGIVYRWHVSTGTPDFFLFVSVVAWLFVIVLFTFNIVGLMRKFEHNMRDIAIAIGHANFALFLLISSALIADHAVRLSRQESFCHLFGLTTGSSCAAYDTAVAFGLFAMIAFVVDAVLYFFEWKKHYSN